MVEKWLITIETYNEYSDYSWTREWTVEINDGLYKLYFYDGCGFGWDGDGWGGIKGAIRDLTYNGVRKVREIKRVA